MQEYKGNCHCGAYKFTLKLPSSLNEMTVSNCDCSICSKNGALWIFPIHEENLIVHSGKDALQIYEFASKKMPYSFCPKCGSSIMVTMKGSPEAGAGINARMLKDIDIDKLQLKSMAGSAYGGTYEVPTFPTEDEVKKVLNVSEGLKIYNGNCHCRAITYSVVTKPLEEQEVMCCNCSLCSKHGDLYIYPKKNQVVVHTGDELLTTYAFLSEDCLHTFCRVCGVNVLVKVLGEGEDRNDCPLNVRTLVDFPMLNKKVLKMIYYDGKKNDPQYIIG